ncbi:MAG: aromatic amino acid ammonia-lyase [Roseovarius sp.]
MTQTTKSFFLSGEELDIPALVAIAGGAPVEIEQESLTRVRASRAVLEHAAQAGQAIYGVTRGLGARSGSEIEAEARQDFSLQTLRGRAQAIGTPEACEVLRAAMAIRLNTLLTGHTGASEAVAEHLATCLNAGLTPVAGRIGSIGVSDLVINATMGLALMGEGRMTGPDGVEDDAANLLVHHAIPRPALGPRDGLALAGHSGVTIGTAALGHEEMRRAFLATQMAAALTMEGFRANLSPLDPRALQVKPLPGQQRAAAMLHCLLEGSDLWQPGKARRLQDPLSIRHAVQIHGALQLALDQAQAILLIELNGASDNPVTLLESGEVISCGAYYTAELAQMCEGVNRAALAAAMAQVARIAKHLNPVFSDLPVFLARAESGSNGFAPVMKTAESLVAAIAHAAQPPALWPSLNANGVEDTLSTGLEAARAMRVIAGHLRALSAIEALVALQAIEMRGDMGRLGPPLAALAEEIRGIAPALTADRPLSRDIERMAEAFGAETLGRRS